jgi:hypothetical protein
MRGDDMSNVVRFSSRPRDDKAKQFRRTSFVGLLFAAGWASCALADQPLVIQKQGSFMAGGTVVSTPGTFDPMNPTSAGQTLSGDHSYVQFQIPAGANRQNSTLMWGSFVGHSWETTPDGREGFEQIFLRRNWSVYVADRPRNGPIRPHHCRNNDHADSR